MDCDGGTLVNTPAQLRITDHNLLFPGMSVEDIQDGLAAC